MSIFGSERSSVQSPLISHAADIGWSYVSRDEALGLRGGKSEQLFRSITVQQLIALNPGLITQNNVDSVISSIESVRRDIQGNKEIFAWLRGEKTAYDEKEKCERNVTLIDFENPENNRYQITDEWTSIGPPDRRADVIFLINGIPVAIVETKSANKKRAIEEGFIQIRQYHQDAPAMLVMPQVFDITDLLGFHYGVTWNLQSRNLFKWKSLERENFESKVKNFFSHTYFLRLLKDWIIFFHKNDELHKTILRQHQTQARESIVSRCTNSEKTKGLIWHTQGSGKTFTMITAANMMLKRNELIETPTVILIIDRNELEGQLSGWVNAILKEQQLLGITVKQSESKQHLKELLQSDFRGLIITMIHKFDDIPENINTRENIFVFIDEAHRSVGGDLGNYLVAALPNATLVGFTGTPIDNTAYGKGTFKIFGDQDESGYLDKYSIAESIKDGTTLKLHYTLAPSNLQVPYRQLDKEFLELAEAEGVSDIEALNKILDRTITIKNFLKADRRVKKVAAFIAEHFIENIEPLGYKAFLVAVDREACALYKKELDILLPPGYVEAVYTPSQHDSEEYPLIDRYQLSKEDEKRLREDFLDNSKSPKIFIVTDKLLTGYDAPILYCMYMDKPMRDHVLLQAIARVNRPAEFDGTSKACGLVVDFIGIFNNLKKALAFDSDDINGAIENLDLLRARFIYLINEKAESYLVLCQSGAGDKVVEHAIKEFDAREKREVFFELYKEIETLYEILSPDRALRSYIQSFSNLAKLYSLIKKAFNPDADSDPSHLDLAQKTTRLVRQEIQPFYDQPQMEQILLDDEAIEKLKTDEEKKSQEHTVINLLKRIKGNVVKEKDKKLFLKSISQEAEKVRESYEQNQCSTKQAVLRLLELNDDIKRTEEEQKKTGLNNKAFAIYMLLKNSGIDNPNEQASILENLFSQFPYYQENDTERRELRRELYSHLLKTNIADTTNNLQTLVDNLFELSI